MPGPSDGDARLSRGALARARQARGGVGNRNLEIHLGEGVRRGSRKGGPIENQITAETTDDPSV